MAGRLGLVQAQGQDVLVLEIEGPVTPAMASYFERGIAEAEAIGRQALFHHSQHAWRRSGYDAGNCAHFPRG